MSRTSFMICNSSREDNLVMLRCLVLLIGILVIRPDLLVAADPVAPPAPAEYAVQIRYDIRAFLLRGERMQNDDSPNEQS